MSARLNICTTYLKDSFVKPDCSQIRDKYVAYITRFLNPDMGINMEQKEPDNEGTVK